MKRCVSYSLVFFLIIAVSSCGIFGKKDDEWKPVKPRRAALVHTIQWSQETLQIIAAWYTGDKKNWEPIADANPAINPDDLAVGDTVYIPTNLIKTRKPLTKDFVTQYYKKPKPKQPKKTTTAPPAEKPPEESPAEHTETDDEIEFFGPK